MAGLVFKLKFVASGGKAYKNYIDYIDREEAQNWAFQNDKEYAAFQNYMGNPEKSTGLFTESQDSLSLEEKRQLKEVYSHAQEQGGLMYQGVFSFEWSWLIENGLATADKQINEAALREYTRKSVSVLQKAENLSGWAWSGAIHYNTEHLHIHIAIADPAPSWKEGVSRCRRNANGELYQRGKITNKSREKTRSTFINAVLNCAPENKLINEISRERIIASKREHSFHASGNRQIKDAFQTLFNKLPNDMRLWKYNMAAMDPYREEIDRLSKFFIKEYFQEDYLKFEEAVEQLSRKYTDSYGNSQKGTVFVEGKEKDLLYRLGNTILAECRQVRKEQRKVDYNASSEKLKEKRSEKKMMSQAVYALKKALFKDIESMKNQAIYESLQKESEYEKS